MRIQNIDIVREKNWKLGYCFEVDLTHEECNNAGGGGGGYRGYTGCFAEQIQGL